jgi:hypothetical protein
MRAYTGGGPDLIWYGAAGNRTKASIRDDYGGYLSYDTTLADVQQCLAHLYRYLEDAYGTDDSCFQPGVDLFPGGECPEAFQQEVMVDFVEGLPALLRASMTSPRRSGRGRRAGCLRRRPLSC